MRPKGIFCLEGLWRANLRDRSTVRPMLDLLERREGIPFIYHDCATVSELEFFIRRFTLAQYERYSILYLAFHGTPGAIEVGDGTVVDLDRLAACFPRKKQSVVILASCSTADAPKALLKRFMTVTGAIAVCGYRAWADWLPATAFEVLLLATLQENVFSGTGINAIVRKTTEEARRFKELRFKITSAYQ